MTLQIYVIERKPDGSEEGRGLCEFVSIPSPGDQIFVAQSTFTDQMRVLAIKHYPLRLSTDVHTWVSREPKMHILAEMVQTHRKIA